MSQSQVPQSLVHGPALHGPARPALKDDPVSQADCRCHVLIVCPKHLPVQYAEYAAQHSAGRPLGGRL